MQADMLLRQWGAWQRGNRHNGWSQINILYRIEKEGAGASHSTVPGEPHMPATVEIVERFCLTLNKPLLRVIKHYYIGRETPLYASKKLHISEEEFERRLTVAIADLEDFLVET